MSEKPINVAMPFPTLSILLLVFITLKLTGHILWPWYWVLAPLWIPLSFVLLLVMIAGVIALCRGK